MTEQYLFSDLLKLLYLVICAALIILGWMLEEWTYFTWGIVLLVLFVLFKLLIIILHLDR